MALTAGQRLGVYEIVEQCRSVRRWPLPISWPTRCRQRGTAKKLFDPQYSGPGVESRTSANLGRAELDGGTEDEAAGSTVSR